MTHPEACSFSVASRNHYHFTGKERDAESGLDEFGARYYGSSLGRFMKMSPMSVRIERDGQIRVNLRHAETASEMDDEVILDVDHAGHWIRGIEVIGSVGFDLARAVRPFNPKSPSEAHGVGVTYDEEANAAFFHVKMAFPSGVASRYAHSITPPARFGLDEQGGFVWVTFSAEEANENPEDFLAFVDTPVEREATGPNAT